MLGGRVTVCFSPSNPTTTEYYYYYYYSCYYYLWRVAETFLYKRCEI